MLHLVAASLLWSISFALIDQSGIDPDLLAALRLGLAGLLFLPLIPRGLRSLPNRLHGPKLAAVGALQFGVMYILVMRAYGHLKGHEVALLTITTPVLVVLLGALLPGGRGSKRRHRAWLAALIAVAAAYPLRSGGAALGEEPGFWTGVLLVQLANLAWAAGQVWYARLETSESDGAAARFGWMYLGAATVTGAWAAAQVEPQALRLTVEQRWTVLYLGVVPSGLAFYLWNRGAARVPNGTLAVMNNLKIPLAVAVALLPPFNEPADLQRLSASAALLALALYLAHSAPFVKDASSR